MAEVIKNLNTLCWELVAKLEMKVIPVRPKKCNHYFGSVIMSGQELLNYFPPMWSCGCMADGMHPAHANRGTRRTHPSQVEALEMELREIRVERENRAVLEQALRSREVLPPSPRLDQENVLPINETAAEVAAIRNIIMNTLWWDDYVIDHRFRPHNTYVFSLRCHLRGDLETYCTVGMWNPARLKLLCHDCATEDLLVQHLEPLLFFAENVTLTSDGEGIITIPYNQRPGWYLTTATAFANVRESLMFIISEMRLPMFMNFANLWEFHCSQCYVNLFTERVVNRSRYYD